MNKYIRFDFPVDKNHYCVCHIWKCKRDFKKATESDGDACFCRVNFLDQRRRYPLLGEFHFVKGKIGSGMVAHEITHAARHYQRLMNKKKNEEFLCETAQIMTINLWNGVSNNKKANKWVYGKKK